VYDRDGHRIGRVFHFSVTLGHYHKSNFQYHISPQTRILMPMLRVKKGQIAFSLALLLVLLLLSWGLLTRRLFCLLRGTLSISGLLSLECLGTVVL